MIRILSTLFALALSSQAIGNNATAVPTPEQGHQTANEARSSAVAGYRISAANDFALVEHGLWRPLSRIPAAALPTETSKLTALHAPKVAITKRTSASTFRRAAYLPHVYAAEVRFGLPSGLLDALIWTESRYNPMAVSRAGAAGLGQLMPGTAIEVGVANRFDPYANISGAARYLRQMLDRFGLVHLALAAYNAGPGAVARVRGIPANGETPAYVRGVLVRWATK